VSEAKGGLKTCEHCRSSMSLFADICPHCGQRAYGGIFGASRHTKQVAEARDPGVTERIKAQKRDRDKTHAYCGSCHRRIYAGEVACEAGHRLSNDWEAKFAAKQGVPPEKRAGGPHPTLARNPPPRSGRSPHDVWLNEIAVELADYGLTETGRNLDKEIGGAPLEAQLKLEGDNFVVFVMLFPNDELARQGEIGLRANPKIREAIAGGFTAIMTIDRALYLANGRGQLIDETRLGDVIELVTRQGIPPPAKTPTQPTAAASTPEPDATPEPKPTGSTEQILEQIRKLGELHGAGILTDAEFEAKKTELLKRI
jgi:hypothetical protein